jgi:putative addiction module component (TIGR02574 family)
MSSTVLETEALKLSAEEKAHMIDALWQSLDPAEQKAVDHAWLAESRERLRAFRADELKALDGETSLNELTAELRK